MTFEESIAVLPTLGKT